MGPQGHLPSWRGEYTIPVIPPRKGQRGRAPGLRQYTAGFGPAPLKVPLGALKEDLAHQGHTTAQKRRSPDSFFRRQAWQLSLYAPQARSPLHG